MRTVPRLHSAHMSKVLHSSEDQMFHLAMENGDHRAPDESPRVYYSQISHKSWNFDHTLTPTELQGQGKARAVVEGAFDYCDKNDIDYSKSTCTYVVKLLRERQ